MKAQFHKGGDNMDDGKICLCSNCIDAIKSRGEKIFVGDSMYFELDNVGKCEWCEELFEASDLYDCRF